MAIVTLQLIIILLSSRFQLKTQFDKNVVTHFEAQEQVLDYIFSHLGVDNEGSVPHPIVMTEAFVTPNYSRQCNELYSYVIVQLNIIFKICMKKITCS